jgi:hypothetical protein
MLGIEKRVVYILRSETNPQRHYVGITNTLRLLEAALRCGLIRFGR